MAVPIILGLLAAMAQAPAAVAGANLYAATCAACHGADAKGDNGPNLTTLWASGATDDRVFETIRRGVPGSAMPPSAASTGTDNCRMPALLARSEGSAAYHSA